MVFAAGLEADPMRLKPFDWQRTRRLGLVLLAALTVTPNPLAAQRRSTSPDTILALLASSDSDRRNGGAAGARAAFTRNHSLYTAAQRQRILDGLEGIARGDIAGDELSVTRSITRAFSALVLIALDTVPVPEDREIPMLLLRIYRESRTEVPKGLVVRMMGDLIPRYAGNPVVQDMLDLLEAVATDTWTPDKVSPAAAVDELIDAGPAALPVLRRLNEERAVKDPQARVYLREMAKRGFRKGG